MIKWRRWWQILLKSILILSLMFRNEVGTTFSWFPRSNRLSMMRKPSRKHSYVSINPTVRWETEWSSISLPRFSNYSFDIDSNRLRRSTEVFEVCKVTIRTSNACRCYWIAGGDEKTIYLPVMQLNIRTKRFLILLRWSSVMRENTFFVTTVFIGKHTGRFRS